MTTRTITIDLKTILDSGWAYGTVSFEMITDIATSGASIYPQSLQKIKMDVDGVGSVDLAVPDTGAWVYEVRLPSTQESQIVVEAGAAVTLAELLETGLTPAPPSGDSYWVRLDGTNTPMTGELLLSGDPVSDAGAATKQTVDTKQDKDTDATAANVAIFDANGQTVDAGFPLGTAAQSDAADFDATGSAAAVAGDLSTHEGLTGTAVHGLGTMATETATDYYPTSAFSASPTAAEPLKAADGGLQLNAGTVATVPMVINLATGQTANGFEVQTSSGTALFFITPTGGAQFGGTILYAGQTTYGGGTNGGLITWSGTDFVIQSKANKGIEMSGGGVTSAKFDNNTTAGQTRFLVYDIDNGTLERVTVGAADSGGVGFKVLRIPN